MWCGKIIQYEKHESTEHKQHSNNNNHIKNAAAAAATEHKYNYVYTAREKP